MEDKGNESKKIPHTTPTRQGLYAAAAVHAFEAIKVLSELMNSADNDSVRVGAAKTLLAKAIPDLKALEISGDDVRPLIIKLDDNPTISNQATGSLESTKGRQS